MTNSFLSRLGFFTVALSLGCAIVLSIISWLGLCSLHCSATENFHLLGLPFALIGLTFFPLLLLAHLFSQKYSLLSEMVSLAIAASVGSEIMFIIIQKWQIGHWCPVCLSIAACVAVAACTLLIGYCSNVSFAIQHHNKGQTMKKIKQGLLTVSCSCIGFLVALFGITKVDPIQAEINDIKNHLAYGTQEKPVEVYFVTDWFCPSCKKVEPFMEKLYPKIKSNVTFYFIDYPIHKKSLNFSPYNLAFLINNKTEYFKARDMLMQLTEKTEDPKDEDIEKAAKKEGLSFHELPYIDVKAGMEYFDKIVTQYNLNSTPTVIITNPSRKSVVKLEGRDEISEEKILNAIKQMTPAH